MAQKSEKYKTFYYKEGEELPRAGTQCKICPGFLVESQYGGLWCKSCKWKYKVSQYDAKGEEMGGTKAVIHEHDQGVQILKKLDEILAILDQMNNGNPPKFVS